MKQYELDGSLWTINELSECHGISPPTLRDRLRRGYTVEEAVKESPLNESVTEFCEASYWKDWIGMLISDLYSIYWKWCIGQGYTPLSNIAFSQQLFRIYPQLKTIPMKGKRYIRLRR